MSNRNTVADHSCHFLRWLPVKRDISYSGFTGVVSSNKQDLQFDRSDRPLEFWAATLAIARSSEALNEFDLEAGLSLALRSCQEGAPPKTKAHAMYVIGRSLMLLRHVYPDWSEWVAHAAVLAGDWALASGDEVCQERSEAMFGDYVLLLKQT